MSKMITLTLPSEIVDDFLNHLHDGVEVWRDTEEYLSSGSIVAPCIVAECSSVRKARRMIRIHEEAIALIENKTGKRKGNPHLAGWGLNHNAQTASVEKGRNEWEKHSDIW